MTALFGLPQIERGRLARDFAALKRLRLLKTLLTPPRFSYVALLPKVCEVCSRLWCREIGSGKRLAQGVRLKLRRSSLSALDCFRRCNLAPAEDTVCERSVVQTRAPS